MPFGVERMNVLLNVICYCIPPPVKHVKSGLKQARVAMWLKGHLARARGYFLYVMSAWYWLWEVGGVWKWVTQTNRCKDDWLRMRWGSCYWITWSDSLCTYSTCYTFYTCTHTHALRGSWLNWQLAFTHIQQTEVIKKHNSSHTVTHILGIII